MKKLQIHLTSLIATSALLFLIAGCASKPKPAPSPKLAPSSKPVLSPKLSPSPKRDVPVADQLSYYDQAQQYYRGNGVEKDYQKALELFLQSYEDKGGNTTATFIGNIYAFGGYGVNTNRDLAIEWYNKSVAGGKFGTYCRLIDTYLSFSDPSLRDIDKAVECAKILEEKNTISWANLGYVAKAYAYAEMFDDAIRVQNEAIKLYQESGKSTPTGMKKYEQRLSAYLRHETR